MNRLTLKKANRMWPTVQWRNTQILVYYLGEKEDDNKAYFTNGIDFEELLIHLDRGGSVFVTTLPKKEQNKITKGYSEKESKPVIMNLL